MPGSSPGMTTKGMPWSKVIQIEMVYRLSDVGARAFSGYVEPLPAHVAPGHSVSPGGLVPFGREKLQSTLKAAALLAGETVVSREAVRDHATGAGAFTLPGFEFRSFDHAGAVLGGPGEAVFQGDHLGIGELAVSKAL